MPNNQPNSKPPSKTEKSGSKQGIWLQLISTKKAHKSVILHKKTISFICGIDNDSMFVSGSKDGAAKVFSTGDNKNKKILFAGEAGVRCGTTFRSDKIIAVIIYNNNGIVWYI